MTAATAIPPPPGAAIAPTLDLREAAARRWDALVVGAGPAGASAAWASARRSLSVLLVDRVAFPREKVCGCCLGPAAMRSLTAMGLGDLPERLGAPPLRTLRLAAGNRVADLPLAGGAAISRGRLDTALVRRAVAAGVAFLPGTVAALGEAGDQTREVHLTRGGAAVTARAAVVLAADGLAGRLLAPEPSLAGAIDPRSRIGVGAALDAENAPAAYAAGTVFMACDARGYVGLVRLEDGRLDVAAALDPHASRVAGGPGPLVGEILVGAGLPPLQPAVRSGGREELTWRGTPRLTRHRPLAARRLLVLGDAAGYVEPFTGEGIAWALTSGLAIASLVETCARGHDAEVGRAWTRAHRRLLGRRQRRCGWLTSLLRRPHLTRGAVSVLARTPPLARYVVRAFQGA